MSLLAAAVAALAWLGLPLPPFLPPTGFAYLGRTAAQSAAAPLSLAGLVPVPPERAEAVVFKGGFGFGAGAALEAALAAAPRARLVGFESPGGRPLAAQAVAEVIAGRHLATTVSGYCASACTIAYLAGSPRSATPGARFGFHLGTSPVLESFAATMVLQIERKWFVIGGASLTFAGRALYVPNPDPYFAPLDELMAAGYVQRLAPPPKPSRPGSPLLRAVAMLEPQTAYALQEAASGPGPRAAEIAEQRAGLVVDRWLRHGSDTAVLALTDATLAALEALGQEDPRACMAWQVARDGQDIAAARIPAALRERYRAAQIALLDSAAAYPVPTPDDADGSLAAAEQAVRGQVAAALGTDALQNAASAEHGFDDPARSCQASMAYLRGLRAAPQAARLLRWSLAAG